MSDDGVARGQVELSQQIFVRQRDQLQQRVSGQVDKLWTRVRVTRVKVVY